MKKFKYTVTLVTSENTGCIFIGYYNTDKDMRADIQKMCPDAHIISFKRICQENDGVIFEIGKTRLL